MNRFSADLARTYLLSRKRRTATTVAGITLGVAMVVVIALLSGAMLSQYRTVLDGVAGRAELQVTSIGGLGFPEGLRDEVAAVEGVRAAVGAVSSGAPMRAADRESSALLYGVDAEQDTLVRDYRVTGGRLPDNGRELAITDELARSLKVGPGDGVDLLTVSGFESFTVVGTIAGGGTVRGRLGPFGVLPLDEAQAAFAKTDKLDTIDVLLAEGADRSAVESQIGEVLAGRARVGEPRERANDLRQMLDSLVFVLTLAGSISVFAGAFIVYTNVGRGVAERRRELSTLRALGMRAREMVTLVVAEGAAVGLCGALLGFGLGYALSVVMVRELTDSFLSIYGIRAGAVEVSPLVPVLAMAVGAGVSSLAALGPARATASISPVEAMKAPEIVTDVVPVGWRRPVAGVALVGASLAVQALLLKHADLTDAWARRGAGVLMMTALLGVVVLLPIVVAPLNRGVLRRIEARLFGVSGRLATDNLVRQPRRTGATASALMVSVAFMIAIGGYAASQRAAIEDFFDRAVRWDLLVSSSFGLAGAQVEIDEAMVGDLGEVPGVAVAAPEKFEQIILGDGKPAYLEGFDHRVLGLYSEPPLEAGSWPEVLRQMVAGGAVVLSSPLAERLGVGVGDTVSIPTPGGARPFRVVGLRKELTPFGGTVELDLEDYAAYWDDRTASAVALVLAEGADPETVRRAILERWPDANFTVKTRNEFWGDTITQVGAFYRLLDGLIWVSVLVSALAIANMLFAGLLERRRELGLLRAIGARRADLGKMVVGEALSTGIMGGAAGIGAGLVLWRLMVASAEQVSGTAVDPAAPWVALATAGAVSLLLGPLVALLPARQAGRLDIVDALSYE